MRFVFCGLVLFTFRGLARERPGFGGKSNMVGFEPGSQSASSAVFFLFIFVCVCGCVDGCHEGLNMTRMWLWGTQTPRRTNGFVRAQHEDVHVSLFLPWHQQHSGDVQL